MEEQGETQIMIPRVKLGTQGLEVGIMLLFNNALYNSTFFSLMNFGKQLPSSSMIITMIVNSPIHCHDGDMLISLLLSRYPN